MRNIFITLFSALTIAVVFSGCSKSSSGPSNIASVMFVNGCVLATNINFDVKNVQQSGAANIAFFASSGYQNVTAGSGILLSYYLANPVTFLDSETVNLTAGDHYSVFAGNGLVSSPSLIVTTDDLTAPASTNAKIRFVNLSSDSLNETVTMGDSTIATGINKTGYSTFFQVPAGTYSLKAIPTNNIPATVVSNSMFFTAGKIYTAILTGSQSGSGTAGLTVTVIGNN